MPGQPTSTTQYTPCRWCIWYGGPSDYPSHSYCSNPAWPPVKAQPEFGCCSWQRAPGTDDDADMAALPYGTTIQTPTSG